MNKYEKIQVGFKSFIPLEHELEGDQLLERSKRKQEYRMEIKFENISKVQWFQTIEENGVVESVYDGASDEDRGQDNSQVETTILLYLKRPATFY